MGLFADIDGDMFPPDEPTPEEAKRLAQEYRQYVEVAEELPWETDRCEVRPIDLKEKEALVRQKCSRAARILEAKTRYVAH